MPSRRRLSTSDAPDVPVFDNNDQRGLTLVSSIHGPEHIHQALSNSELGNNDDNNSSQKETSIANNPRRRRLSVFGSAATTVENTFETRPVEVRGAASEAEWVNTLNHLGIAFTCRKGLKPESPNQDDFFLINMTNWSMFGVFDGHGPSGHHISHFVQQQLPGLIYRDREFNRNPLIAMKNSFLAVHQHVSQQPSNSMLHAWSSGTTATILLHRIPDQKLFIAHVGDSRAVIAKKIGEEVVAVDLVQEHKPNLPSERARVEAAGGKIHHFAGDIPHRVFLPGRPYPGLAMSRAIGDIAGSEAGIIPDPDLSEVQLTKQDIFIIIASDGVWEFISSQEAVNIVNKHGISNVNAAVNEIAKESWNRWLNEEENVVDDITIQVFYL